MKPLGLILTVSLLGLATGPALAQLDAGQAPTPEQIATGEAPATPDKTCFPREKASTRDAAPRTDNRQPREHSERVTRTARSL